MKSLKDKLWSEPNLVALKFRYESESAVSQMFEKTGRLASFYSTVPHQILYELPLGEK